MKTLLRKLLKLLHDKIFIKQNTI
jgi:hypothetical protein